MNKVIHSLYFPEHRDIVFLLKFGNHIPDYRTPWPERQLTIKTAMKTLVSHIILHGPCLSGVVWVVGKDTTGET